MKYNEIKTVTAYTMFAASAIRLLLLMITSIFDMTRFFLAEISLVNVLNNTMFLGAILLIYLSIKTAENKNNTTVLFGLTALTLVFFNPLASGVLATSFIIFTSIIFGGFYFIYARYVSGAYIPEIIESLINGKTDQIKIIRYNKTDKINVNSSDTSGDDQANEEADDIEDDMEDEKSKNPDEDK